MQFGAQFPAIFLKTFSQTQQLKFSSVRVTFKIATQSLCGAMMKNNFTTLIALITPKLISREVSVGILAAAIYGRASIKQRKIAQFVLVSYLTG